MVRRRNSFVLPLMLGLMVLFPIPGWGQEGISPRVLQELFYDLLMPSLIICLIGGAATATGFRFFLRHRERVRFPLHLRKYTLFALAGWTVLYVLFYLVTAWVKGIPPLVVATFPPYNWVAPLGFALLWYLTAYAVYRIGRWSGLYAMWPTRLSGGRS